MKEIVEFVVNNYTIFIIITVFLFLSLLGYISVNVINKDIELKVRQKRERHDLEDIKVTEDKSIGEFLNKPSELDKLNKEE